MNAIHIRKIIDSEMLHLPELTPFIGHTVDIVIEDHPLAIPPNPAVVPGTGDWDALGQAAAMLRETFDYDAITRQDLQDLRAAQEGAGGIHRVDD